MSLRQKPLSRDHINEIAHKVATVIEADFSLFLSRILFSVLFYFAIVLLLTKVVRAIRRCLCPHYSTSAIALQTNDERGGQTAASQAVLLLEGPVKTP